MKRLLTLHLLFFFYIPLIATGQPYVSSLLKELDIILSENNKYSEQKEDRLNRLKSQLEIESFPEKQFDICHSIIEEYKSYISDSALVYIYKNLNLSEKTKNKKWMVQTKIQQFFVLASSGLFVESESIFNSIDKKELTADLYVSYYDCKAVLYANLYVYMKESDFLDQYSQLLNDARDSLLHYLPADDPQRFFYYYVKAEARGELDQALEYLIKLVNILQPGTHDHAKKSYSLSGLYHKLGEEDKSIEHLIMAVISDIKDSVKENRALLELAIWLYQQGDIERAYRYIQFALDDANFYGSRLRYYEISQALPIITKAFQERNELQNNRLKFTNTTITILLILLIGSIIYLNKQMKALRSARKRIDKSNRNLEDANERLNHLNNDLKEANTIKEEYIGYFLDLCSEHISRLEDYRKTINHKIVTKRFDELLKTTAPNYHSNEIKELYKNFDKAFLNIYPNFVSSLNRLLKPEEQFIIKKNELNTELRVFALIRLGITDSTKIASFLRSSVQTVYNYRSKIKKKTISGNDDIEETIKQIGDLHEIN